MGEGECYDLTRIGWVGHDFLVPGYRGVETHFTDGFTVSTCALAPKQCAVGENKHSRGVWRREVRILRSDSHV